MNKAAFYAHLRKRETKTFGTSLTQDQVNGIEALLAAGADMPRAWLSYGLATARGEVGSKMQPVSENLNYSAQVIERTFGAHRRQGFTPLQLARKPELLANTVYGGEWGRENLGNTAPDDGWRFRGRGFAQTTGRRNYGRIGGMTGLDLVGNPDLLLRPDLAGVALFKAMEQGVYTGKSFKDYLPRSRAARADFASARRIINGTDKADTFAGYAMDFQAALVAAGYEPGFVRPDVEPLPTPKPIWTGSGVGAKPASPMHITWRDAWVNFLALFKKG